MSTKSGVWQFFQDGEWYVGMNVNNHRENTEADGIPTRDLHVIPEGYALVPIDLLDNICDKLNQCGNDLMGHDVYDADVDEIKAMIAAAQDGEE